MADTRENLQEAERRRSNESESRSMDETKGQALDSRVNIMNKNFAVGHYDDTESIQISEKKGDEDEKQNCINSRPEKRAKTISDSIERFKDLEKGVDIPKNLSVDVQDTLHEQIKRQRREADQDNLKQQSSNETKARDKQNMEQERDIERKGREIRFRLDQFFDRQKKKKQQLQEQQQEMKSQQQQEFTQHQQQKSPPPLQQHQSLVYQFHLYPLVEKLTDVVETGTRDTNSVALVTELSSHFNKCQQLLNSISRSLGSKTMTVSEEKRKLEESEKLLQQRRDSKMDYKKSVEDILKREP